MGWDGGLALSKWDNDGLVAVGAPRFQLLWLGLKRGG